jgi:hypothetical protein
VLDRIEEAGEAPRRLPGSDRDHSKTLYRFRMRMRI